MASKHKWTGDRLYTTRMARAMSPAAIVATGAGAAGSLTRVALALPRRASTRLGRPEDLHEPWRAFVEDAHAANNRFGDNAGDLVTQLDAMRQALDDPRSTSVRASPASQPSDDLA